MMVLISVLAVLGFLVGCIQDGKDEEHDSFVTSTIKDIKELKKENDHLYSQLEMPDHGRMEITELQLDELRNQLHKYKKKCKLLREEVKLLTKTLKAVSYED